MSKTHTATLTEHDAWGRPHTWSITWAPLRISHRNNHNIATDERFTLWGSEDEPPAWPVKAPTNGDVYLRAPVIEHTGVPYEPFRVQSVADIQDPGDYHAEEI